MTAFTPDLYAQLRDGCQRSAAAVVPLVHELVQPRAVVDVGGGEGWWGREFFNLGCDVFVADESVEVWRFEHEPDGGRKIDYQWCNLQEPTWAGRIADERAELARIHGGAPTFDLAVCLEVAEHLPTDFADPLVAGLCALAPVVLFSAAIPGQGGNGHINCQWPAYWAELFTSHGYMATERLRWRFWDDDRVEPWYRQNMLLFATREWIDARKVVPARFVLRPSAVVHPDIWTGSGR